MTHCLINCYSFRNFVSLDLVMNAVLIDVIFCPVFSRDKYNNRNVSKIRFDIQKKIVQSVQCISSKAIN